MANTTTPRVHVKLRVACPSHLASELQALGQLAFAPQSSRRVIKFEGVPVWQVRVNEVESWDLDHAIDDALATLSPELESIDEFCRQHSLSKWLSVSCEFNESPPSIVLSMDLLKALVEWGLWLDLHMDLLRA